MSEQLSRSFGTENQLLFDDERVADKLGFTLTLNPPTRGEALALEPEREWETRGIHLPSVAASQEGVHRMY